MLTVKQLDSSIYLLTLTVKQLDTRTDVFIRTETAGM